MPYGITYMWNLNYDRNELTHETNRLTGNRLVGAGGGAGLGEGGGCWGQLAYIECMNSKVLMDSTENSVQYPMTKHSGKEYLKKEQI